MAVHNQHVQSRPNASRTGGGFEHLAHGVLDQLVLERRDPNRPRLALFLRDEDPPDRLMAIALRLHPRVEKMLEVRVADGSLLRLIGKCLHVGVLEGVELSTPEAGTVQGSVLSPLLGNVYLHYALDRWFRWRVKPRLRGQATLVRYADDFVIGFEYQDDAQRVRDALGPRLGYFGLTLHPDKTRLISFRRPPRGSSRGKGRATFDFLGFTLYGARTRKGRWGMFCKTAVRA